MPYDCQIDTTRMLGLTRLSGVVRGHDFIRAMEELYHHPDWRPGLPALWDARTIEQLLIDPSDVQHIVATLQTLEPLIGGGRAAFVVPRDIDYMMARLLIYKGTNPVRERRTFSHVEPALEWLRGVDEVSPLRTAS